MGKDDYIHPEPAERKRRIDGLVESLHYAETLGASGVIGLPVRREIPLPDLSPVADVATLVTQLTLNTLREANYDGWFALECGIPGDPMVTIPAAVRFIRQCWDSAGS